MKTTSSLEIVPVKFAEIKQFIADNHRHHVPTVGWLWGHGLSNGSGTLIGCAVVGRPVARNLDDGFTCEVTRLCTLGDRNACSKLYSVSRKVAILKGYRRGITYILESEPGTSLKASGWDYLYQSPGGSWSSSKRPREDKHPLEPKQAWGWGEW